MTKRILVVDDKANVRQLLSEYLTGQGYQVETAVNGREALYAARHFTPDVILLDIMMPEMDGYAFLKEYRRDRSVPVIIITAREEETDTVLGLELGADDYVIKPFRMRELAA
ncbi:MAG TPA: response regulator, partial [Anaerolineales bacterium]|nr:response regulator [Anaerolineales bacterium]